MEHFTDGIKKNYSKRKFMNGPQRIVHVNYVKRTYKTLDLCKLPVRTYFEIFYAYKVICWGSNRWQTIYSPTEIDLRSTLRL